MLEEIPVLRRDHCVPHARGQALGIDHEATLLTRENADQLSVAVEDLGRRRKLHLSRQGDRGEGIDDHDSGESRHQSEKR